jgi:hypothetical protein
MHLRKRSFGRRQASLYLRHPDPIIKSLIGRPPDRPAVFSLKWWELSISPIGLNRFAVGSSITEKTVSRGIVPLVS